MYFIALFGVLMAAISVVLMASPELCSEAIVKFSEKSYFHPLEVASRVVFGGIFLAYADETRYPALNTGIGSVLLLVGVGLLLTPSSKHREYAVWSASKFRKIFRPAGVVSFLFGSFIAYAAIQGGGSH